MSWLVQNLLRDRIKIHTEGDMESDSYNDLLVIENKIKELFANKVLSNRDLEIINYVSDGKPLTNSKSHIGKHPVSVSKLFKKICNKISFYLGGYFTDEGYISYMRDKYHLSDEEIEKMIEYMKNEYNYKTMRKSVNAKKFI